MKQLLLATLNPGKIEELRALLLGLPVALITPHDLELNLEVEETGGNYIENAVLKARAFATASQLWSLADDSGLEVEALEGAPGLHSARLAGPGASDADRRTELLKQLQPHPPPWKAAFRSIVALAAPDGSLDTAEGLCEGRIIAEARGSGGFGYDPIFQVDGMGRTMAELSMDEKNKLSHRARAIAAIRQTLLLRLDLSE